MSKPRSSEPSSKSSRLVAAYLSFADREHELARELQHERLDYMQYNQLFVSGSAKKSPALWAQLNMPVAEIHHIESIKEAQQQLLSRGKLWSPYHFDFHRRTQLIQDGLPKIKSAALEFLKKPSAREIGFWCLLDANTLLLSPKTQSPFPLGEFVFAEDKVAPPSRAYLKLWEILTLHDIGLKPGQKTLDFGCAPGGWTWVLEKFGCFVVAIDRAPLDKSLQVSKKIHYIKGDAFSLDPKDHRDVEWFFSDIICDPLKLFNFVENWRATNPQTSFVCTLKFKGETDWQAIHKFRSVEGSRVVHLIHNKHEVTWILKKI